MKKKLVVAIWVTIVVIAADRRFCRQRPSSVSGHSDVSARGVPRVGFAESMEAGALAVSQSRAFNEVHGKTELIQEEAGGYSLFETPAGRYWMASGSQSALEWDLAEQGRRIYGKDGNRGERRGDIVLDCGANVGVYAKTALASGARLVVAIEPAPENVECLRRNLAQEIAAGKVIVYPKGVWDKDDTLDVPPRSEEFGARQPVQARRRRHRHDSGCPLTTIDRLVAELQARSGGLHQDGHRGRREERGSRREEDATTSSSPDGALRVPPAGRPGRDPAGRAPIWRRATRFTRKA